MALSKMQDDFVCADYITRHFYWSPSGIRSQYCETVKASNQKCRCSMQRHVRKGRVPLLLKNRQISLERPESIMNPESKTYLHSLLLAEYPRAFYAHQSSQNQRWQPWALLALGKINSACDNCQNHSDKMNRIIVAILSSDCSFNETMNMNLIRKFNKTVLHVDYQDTTFSAAGNTPEETTTCMWKTFGHSFVAVNTKYLGTVDFDKSPHLQDANLRHWRKLASWSGKKWHFFWLLVWILVTQKLGRITFCVR